ncbi:hypothetical protein B0O80DRAFT_427519 [Mortierella sp. GBAus27b]|nr:hypothetical protein BGX31_003221 [Mortierella sp. GBA43]KAI8352344.1 hypothetical protein B0O80DRAFT_427519 [Mortierella sp. GBAus27b]
MSLRASCRFFATAAILVAGLLASVSDAAPGPTLTHATTCPSQDGGFWVVGVDSTTTLTFVKNSPQSQLTTYSPKQAPQIPSTFKGGKCIEANPTTVYYITGTFQGSLTINSGGDSTWTEVSQPSTGYPLDTTKLNSLQMALTTSPNLTIVAAVTDRIVKWSIQAGDVQGLAMLSELNNITSPDRIQDMAVSSATPNLWLYYLDIRNTPQVLRVNLGKKTDKTPFIAAPAPPQILVPLTKGNGVALVGSNSTATDKQLNTIVSYYLDNGSTSTRVITTASSFDQNVYVVDETTVTVINPTGIVVNSIGGGSVVGAPSSGGATSGGGLPGSSSPTAPSKEEEDPNQLPIIVGSIVGALVLLGIVTAFFITRRRRAAKKQKDLFPIKKDETMVPLGLYHQERGLPDLPRHLNNDMERSTRSGGDHDGYVQSKNLHSATTMAPYPHSKSITEHSHLDEAIPLEKALLSNQYNTPKGLSHSISISSSTSNFPRRNTKSGKRFEEKIQLQVIRYDVQDAHLVSPHGPTGRLVLGTYHIVSPPKSARCVKAQGGASRGVSRSGTVVVRRSRMDFGPGQPTLISERSPSPLRDMAEYSSMLLTDAENQHTFETATLKWYMTEIHWKREAALLKHLKSPIFVMELLESYCIPPLQNRANTYPFVNAMGACSSLLSDVGVVRTAQHARAILRAISGAVDWCHRHGVVHLNIQPGSFFLEDNVDPKAEDAPWKLWDFTCARFMGEPIGSVGGGGGDMPRSSIITSPQPPPNHLSPDAYPYLDQGKLQEQNDRIGGNPLPAAYTAPELLEAWRAGDTTFPAEAAMDTWSLGCVYYEILSGSPLFQTEADAWGLVGGWENQGRWTSKDFRVPYPPTPSLQASAVTEATLISTSAPGKSDLVSGVTDHCTPYERSMILDPSGSVAQLLQDMMKVQADDRISIESIMERIY